MTAPTADVNVHVQATGAAQTIAQLEGVKKEIALLNSATQAYNAALTAAKTGAMVGGASLIAMVAPMIMASKAASGFDANMRRVAALGGGEFKSQLSSMTDAAIKWSTEYGQSLDDISSAMVELVKTGYSYSEVMAMSQPVMQLATANQIESAEAVSVINQEMKIWGEEMGYSAKQMAELSHQAATMSAMDISQLPEMLRYVGSSASIAGITLEQFLSIAGGLSQIGALFGESFGTFIQRLYTSGEELEAVFGVDGIVEDGVINFEALMEVMRKGADDPELWVQAMELWGVRSGRSMAQIHKAATSIDEIYLALNKDGNTLASAANEQAQSLEALWARLSAVFVAPFNTQEVMDSMRLGLEAIRKALESEAFTEALANIIMQSAIFVQQNGPALIQMFIDILEVFNDMMPTLAQLATVFMSVLKIVAAIPAPVWEFIGAFFLISKLIPVLTTFNTLLMQMATVSAVTQMNVMKLGLGLMAIFGGMLLITTSSDPMVRALGAIIMVVGLLTTAYQMMALAEAIANPWMIPAMIAGAASIVAVLALNSTPSVGEPTTSLTAGKYALPSTTNSESTEINNYGDTYINGVGDNNDAVNNIIRQNMEV